MKIGFPVCKKENFAGLQAHRKRGKSARASPTPHHTLNEERSARFTAQPLSALLSCLYVFDQRVPLIFHFSQLSGIFLAQNQHTCLQKVILTSNNSCKEYFVERKRIKSTTAACSKLRMFGGQNRSCLHPIRTCLLLTYVYTLRCNRRYH